MATIFCSGKLSALIGNLPAAKEAVQPSDKLHGWNAHLFNLGGKKCIIFVNKATYYAFLRLGVVKRELADLSAFFQAGLVQQLKADELIDLPFLDTWVNPASTHKFYGTDNDKVLMGTINNLVQNYRYRFNGRDVLNADLEVRYGCSANRYPTGALNHRTPKDEIARLANGGVPVPPKPPTNPFGYPEGNRNPEFLVSEPLSELMRLGAEKLLLQFCEDRIPPEYRDQVRLECKFEGDSAILVERQPDWMDDGPEWSSMEIIRFRYNNKTARWTVYWLDSRDKWHLCEDFEPCESLQELIAGVDDDASGRFWG